MKKTLVALLALGALSAIGTAPAAARDYPFCLMGRDFAGIGDCKYDSYAQCQAAASGREAYCGANPFPGYFDEKAGISKQQPKLRAAR